MENAMKLTYVAATAVSAVFTAGVLITDTALADPPRVQRDVQVIVNGPHGRVDFGAIDANKDGFVSRDEVRAEAERQFAALDRENNGSIAIPARGPRTETRTEMRTVIIQNGADGRTTRIETDDSDAGPRPPRPPRVMHMRGPRGMGPAAGPVMFMMFAHSGEADLNGDGALSKDEFVNQQLRFFDAADANRDGKVKFDPPPMVHLDLDMPEPPEPPEAPTPPAPPRR